MLRPASVARVALVSAMSFVNEINGVRVNFPSAHLDLCTGRELFDVGPQTRGPRLALDSCVALSCIFLAQNAGEARSGSDSDHAHQH